MPQGRTVCLVSVASLVAAIAAGASPLGALSRFDTKTASFAIGFHDEVSAYRELSTFVLPRERLTISAVGGAAGEYRLRDGSAVFPRQSRRWDWTAPDEPGAARDLRVEGPDEHDTIALHVFVMVPASEVHDGMLNGYRIGTYPATPLNGNRIYQPPKGFVEITHRLENLRLTPHFRLKQFECKQGQSGQFPKYVVLKERLLLKLEAILEEVNVLGFEVDTLHVMSAYRTPFYNHAIGDVPYSMHQWGAAADIYIDHDNRDRMDDLTGDGRVDVEDAKYLSDNIERIVTRDGSGRLEGGLGFYPATPAHPPFVHVDVRGARARWHGSARAAPIVQ